MQQFEAHTSFRGSRGVRIVVMLAVAVAGVLLALPAAARASATLDPITPREVTFGTTVTATGSTSGDEASVGVQLEQFVRGAWRRVGVQATTDADGAWSIAFRPQRSGRVRAVQVSGGDTGASFARAIFVAPLILQGTISKQRYPFLGTTATWRVLPATYPDGPVTAEVRLGTVVAGTTRGRVRNGVVTLRLANNGVGSFAARITLPERDAFEGATSRRLTWKQSGPRLSSGARGPWVKALRAALVFRGFHVPGGASFGARMGDSVVAFHKAYGRARTTTFSQDDWKVLTRKRVGIKYTTPANHIEIDKGRQILIKVRNGKPWHIIHISSGATGNTPNGRHQIQWKGPWVPSLYGSLLFRSMAFQGAFAIHGYPSVPTTAASHGCVRVPMWIADWLYDHTPVGETVYIYRGPGGAVAAPGQRAADVPELTGVDVDRWAEAQL